MLKILMMTALLFSSSWSYAAQPKLKCWCHAMAAVYGNVLNCEEYRCPCEGANGKCSQKGTVNSPSFKEVDSIPAHNNRDIQRNY
jgi:hypothetical protein